MSEVVATAQQGLAGKYHPYPEYKDSGVEWLGTIPTHWEMWKLAHAYEVIGSGTTPPTNEEGWFGDGIPWVTTGELREIIIEQTSKCITYEALNVFSALRVHPAGSVVIAMYGATIGRLGILGVNATTNQACCVLTCSIHLDNKYVFYWLQAFRDDIVRLSSGGGQPNINQEKVASLKISAPDERHQRTISAFLDYETARIDRLIAQQQRLIELLKEKRQAVISHAVTKGLNPDAPMKDSGIEWLGQVPEHWVVTALKRYWGVVDCKHITAEFIDDGIPLASIREVQSWEVDLSNAKQTSEEYYNALIDGGRIPENGDIIYSRNATVGEAARVTAEHPRFAMGQDVCLLKRIRKCIDTDFFMYQLKSRIISYQLDTLMVGSTFKRINVDDIRNFVVVIPPEDEAVAIRSYLNDFDRKYKNIEQSASRQVSLLQERRTALISAAVTGKIDLRGWTPPAEEVAA
ncbi:restriction endonuclease subunit S [Aeromonas hydrophila]|uniref:restriction endonuclease subunit S n=1 Tax=Aeromonas hydrophila TaxID=644 RepID=UPI003016764E